MSQSKLHKLSIKNKRPGISTGANTEVCLDGQPLKGVSFLKLEFHAKKVTKVVMEMYVDATDIEIETELNKAGEVVKQTFGTNWVLGKLSSITSQDLKK